MIRLNPRWSSQDTTLLSSLGEWALQNAVGLQAPEVFATSGTTAENVSRTKLVILDQPALNASAMMVNDKFKIDSRDIWLNPLPLFHVGGFGIQKRAELSRSECSHYSGKWSPELFVKELRDKSVTITSLVPTQIFDLVKNEIKAPVKLRLVFVGGSALSSQLLMAAQSLGWPLVMTYGMTETCSMIAVSELGVDNQMRFFDSVEVRVDSATQILSVKANLLLSYYAFYDQQLQRQLVDPKVGSWFQTSDRVEVDNTKAVKILGRSSDQIKILGELVDVHALRQKLGVKVAEYGWDASAMALDFSIHERQGHAIVLYVSKEMGLSEKELLEFAQRFDSIVKPYERIFKIYQVSKIPVSDLGKVLFAELRSLEKSEVMK